MHKFTKLLILTIITLSGYGQRFDYSHCDSTQMIFIDSMGNEVIDNSKEHLLYIHNRADSIILESMFELNVVDRFSFNSLDEMRVFNSYKDSSINKQIPIDVTKYCTQCTKKAIQIIDSIDINTDGVKEVFLFREWHCFVTPSNMGAYGEGGEQRTITQYEVWDVVTKKKIFEVRNIQERQIAITTNVQQNFGYRFSVELNKKGTFILSNPHKSEAPVAMGAYSYDRLKESYVKQ